MTNSNNRSGRRSGRVEPPTPNSEVRSRLGPVSAPERSVSGVGVVVQPPGVPERRERRITRRQLDALQRGLSARELAVLESIEQHRFLTTRQLQFLHFHDHATLVAAARICRRVLARLAELRVIEHLERRVGGIRAGSASYVWRVGLIGDRLLHMARGEGARARRKEPSARYLDHCLAIADCHLLLIAAARRGQLELLQVATEPASWRNYLGTGGTREVLKPDLYAVTALGDFEDHHFVEIDRATESLPTLTGQCWQYERYRRTGHEQATIGVFPRVVWVVPDDVRAAKLQVALSAARGLDPDLFRVTTAADLLGVITGGAA